MDNDPLQSLIVNETVREDRARHLLATILKSYVEISEQTGGLDLLPGVYELPPKEQILIILCGRLAQKYLGKLSKTQDEKITQTEIMEILPTIPEGTVKTSLWWLRDKKFIQNQDRKNFVTPGHLPKIEKRLNELKNKI